MWKGVDSKRGLFIKMTQINPWNWKYGNQKLIMHTKQAMFNEGKNPIPHGATKAKMPPMTPIELIPMIITDLITSIGELQENKTRNWLRLKPW